MAKSSTKRNVAVSASVPAGSAKRGKRVTSVSAPIVPETTEPVADIVAATDTAIVPAVETAPRGLTRDAAGIVAARTNFAQYSDRDTAYLVFFGAVCRANSGAATLRQIHDSGITRSGMPDRKRFNPHYTGSGKATDVGAANRLISAGYFTRSPDGNTLTATARALASSAYLGT